MMDMLNSGEGDIIAFNLTVTKARSERVRFTEYHNISRQVLVQRRPQNWRRMRLHEIEKFLLRNQIELEGKTVYVINGSAYVSRLKNLSDEIGGSIDIVEADPELNMSDLIEMVADGKIDFTVADENIALLYQSNFPILDVSTPISLPQKIAWAVRKNSPQFLEILNSWIKKMRTKTEYYLIYNKYYKNRNAFRKRKKSEYLVTAGGHISQYDDLLKEYATMLGWDWRILVSQVYQESQFDPKAKSWAGAEGLLQLMPATAEIYGVKDVHNPIENLKAGIKYLAFLDKYWSKNIENKDERIKFVLASFNIGKGHIVDARNLAKKYGYNPDIWFGNVELFLLKKANAKYYNDDVVQYGYSKGTETVDYVRSIINRYEHYRELTNVVESKKSADDAAIILPFVK